MMTAIVTTDSAAVTRLCTPSSSRSSMASTSDVSRAIIRPEV